MVGDNLTGLPNVCIAVTYRLHQLVLSFSLGTNWLEYNDYQCFSKLTLYNRLVDVILGRVLISRQALGGQHCQSAYTDYSGTQQVGSYAEKFEGWQILQP